MPPVIEYTSGEILRRGLQLIKLSAHKIDHWSIKSLRSTFKQQYGSEAHVYKEMWLDIQTVAPPPENGS